MTDQPSTDGAGRTGRQPSLATALRGGEKRRPRRRAADAPSVWRSLVPGRDASVDLAFALVLGSIALLGMRTGFLGVEWVVAAWSGLVLGLVVGHVAGTLRWMALTTFAVLVAVYFLLGGPLAVRDNLLAGFVPTGQTFVDLATWAVTGWKKWLTLLPPVDARGPVLALPWLAGLLGGATTLGFARRWANVPSPRWRRWRCSPARSPSGRRSPRPCSSRASASRRCSSRGSSSARTAPARRCRTAPAAGSASRPPASSRSSPSSPAPSPGRCCPAPRPPPRARSCASGWCPPSTSRSSRARCPGTGSTPSPTTPSSTTRSSCASPGCRPARPSASPPSTGTTASSGARPTAPPTARPSSRSAPASPRPGPRGARSTSTSPCPTAATARSGCRPSATRPASSSRGRARPTSPTPSGSTPPPTPRSCRRASSAATPTG